MYGDAFELLKSNAELQRMIGEDMSVFGRVLGGGTSTPVLTLTTTG